MKKNSLFKIEVIWISITLILTLFILIDGLHKHDTDLAIFLLWSYSGVANILFLIIRFIIRAVTANTYDINKGKVELLKYLDKRVEEYKSINNKEGVESIEAFRNNLLRLNDANEPTMLELLSRMTVDNPYLLNVPFEKFRGIILRNRKKYNK